MLFLNDISSIFAQTESMLIALGLNTYCTTFETHCTTIKTQITSITLCQSEHHHTLATFLNFQTQVSPRAMYFLVEVSDGTLIVDHAHVICGHSTNSRES
uniref:Uncharacterized protein n=1 Tax=Percolomonas cosmopolitus TaxID=63605 RepID=A0A7S1KRW5_9EUKA|mmetsp:Transcript_6997/g.26133  ORF Transcript_6997/g.26133 Transcript_6997/m.26133 type:complete len:100 (+) Transcript_6997:237-536(+)